MNEVYRVKAKEVDKIKREAAKETVLKEAAIVKMEELRNEVELLKGDEETTYHLMREEINNLKRELGEQKDQNVQLKSALNQISSQMIGQASTTGDIYGNSVFKHDDSMYSAPADSSSFVRQSNPFGDTKNSLIKKINTEAYLV